MSALARRRDEEDDARRRALLGMRDSVTKAVAQQMPRAGSLAVEEAVEYALEKLLNQDAHRCELVLARNWWISWAKRAVTNIDKSAAARTREWLPVDEHPQALTRAAEDDALELLDDDATILRDEILAVLKGPQQEWAQALFAQLMCERDDDRPLPDLDEVLGWSAAKTKKTAQRACTTMTEFIKDRATGKVCSRRQAVLDAYITATEGHAGAPPAEAAGREFAAVALHLTGCPECQVAWHRRRTSLLARCGALIMVPLDSVAAAAQALAGKLAGLFSGAQNATLSLLQRLGLGGGAAAAGGSAAALGTKTAAVCVGLVCAAGAGVAEITGVLPPIAPSKSENVQLKATQAARPKPTPAVSGAVARRSVGRTSPPPPPPAAVRRSAAERRAGSSSTRTASSTSARRPAVTPPPPPPPPPPAAATSSSQDYTPGDLPAAPLAPPPPPPPPPPAATPGCVPGDLSC
ncbi:MAG TPA: hypothetical protein VGO80_11810 [Solirubrobacteraceae bacterium]|jgi:hypothetical protein|nr:hypothetical protein [Solirubrobacteraceae bacterium]